MENTSIDALTAKQLSRLLDLGNAAPWSHEDAPAILEHQLDAPLVNELEGAPSIEQMNLRESALRLDAVKMSFRSLLTSSRPPLELLEAVKRVARQWRDDHDSPLSGTPATVIYYASIAAALARQDARISQLTDKQLADGCRWASKQNGAKGLAQLFQGAIEKLKT